MYSKINFPMCMFILVSFLSVFSTFESFAAENWTSEPLFVGKDIGSPITWQITVSTPISTPTEDNPQHLSSKVCFSSGSNSVQQCELVEGETGASLEVIKFCTKEEPSSGVLVSSNSWGMAGGTDYLSLWVYDKSSKRFKNILPKEADVRVIALSMIKFIPSLENESVLVIAEPESYFDERDPSDPDYRGIYGPHYVIISIYKYVPNQNFMMIGSFTTKNKYEPEDEEMINSELLKIKALLKKK
jgi:hypothetical protein